MASLEANLEGDEEQEEPWRPYQRPGVLSVDYDDYGAEMAPNARVWKRYVEEADKTDKELVNEWNSMLDIILIFAALFSAISTAFVIESSKDLKPDYTEQSSQTLLLVSQTLVAISRGSSINESAVTSQEPPIFTPSHSAIVVNTLWFLSLSLSVAVSLVAILAKSWCNSFMGGRFGSMLNQGRLRQQRWDGIKQWRMEEILNMLPLLMHIALLLFAIGLSIYLWDINTGVALPVAMTTLLAALFYIITTLLPFFFLFCPYRTPLVRSLSVPWIAILSKTYTLNCIGIVAAAAAWIPHCLVYLKWPIDQRRSDPGPNNADLGSTSPSESSVAPFSFRDEMALTKSTVYYWANTKFRGMFSRVKFSYKDLDQETPMDLVTSGMLRWMIETCEDSKSVDIALQALAGANMELPRRPLWESGAAELLCMRLRTCTDPLKHTYMARTQPAHSLLDNASLFSRSLGFITALVRGEGLDLREPGRARFIIQEHSSPAQKLDPDTGFLTIWARYSLGESDILDFCWIRSPPQYEIAAYEFNNLPVKGNRDMWESLNYEDQWCSRQRELLRLVTNGKVDSLPPSALLSMINGFTKTFLYEPSQSPIPLVELLGKITLSHQNSFEIRYAIGVGVAISVLASAVYLKKEEFVWDENVQLSRAIQAYEELTTPEFGLTPVSDTVLVFGLIGLLTQRTKCDWTLDIAHVKAIRRCTTTIFYLDSTSYHHMISVIPPSFTVDQQLVQLISECLAAFVREPDASPASESPALLRLDAALNQSICRSSGDLIIAPLVDGFMHTTSLELKRLCLRGIQFSVTEASSDVFGHMLQAGFLSQLLEFVGSNTREFELCSMAVLWNTSMASADVVSNPEKVDNLACSSILQLLSNEFTIQGAGGSPASVSDLGLADLWLPKLAVMCQRDPQSVLDSGILREMEYFYFDSKYSSALPRTAKLPSPFNSTWTWYKIVQELENGCRNAVGHRAGQDECQVQGANFNLPVDEDRGAERNEGVDSSPYWAM